MTMQNVKFLNFKLSFSILIFKLYIYYDTIITYN